MTKILVIDDEPDLRETVAELLTLNDFSVTVAATGEMGLTSAQRDLPDLIVCDINMPDLSGFQVLSNLRNNDLTALIPIVFLTARTDYAAIRHCMELGGDDYLAKPFEPNDLIRAVKAQLKKRQQMIDHLQQLEAAVLQGDKEQADPLTGLLSLSGLEEKFYQLTTEPSALIDTLWLTLIKINNYTDFQDCFGHVFGKLILKAVANQLKHWVDTVKPSIHGIAYLGSERFVILALVPTGQSLQQLESSLHQKLTTPITLNNHTIRPQLKLSSIRYTQEEQDFNRCLIKAMWALNPHRSIASPHRSAISMEERIKQGLKRDEFELYYQPQIDVASGKIMGAEALIRWHSPEMGMVSPSQFIPIAEETNLILTLGEWVLRNVCNQLKRWHNHSLLAMTIAINVSAKQFQSTQFHHRLITILEEEQVNPALIDLELTESLLVQDIKATCEILKMLQEIGFTIAIDDFGTGYSSLGYLQQLPINILKIDQCFVRQLHNNVGNKVIVKAIIEMAHGLNITTIAEGVETADELAVLKQFDCNGMQGYLFSPALPANEFEQLIVQGRAQRHLLKVNCYS